MLTRTSTPHQHGVTQRLSAGNTSQGLDLIKRQWGYMLRHPNSTQSTFWEGYQANGQYAFQGIYMSHAHGWATGPAAGLTFYVLGLRPVDGSNGGSGSEYIVAPQPSIEQGVTWCNGSLAFESGAASVHVAWSLEHAHTKHGGLRSAEDGAFNVFVLTVDSTAHPTAAVGRIGLPLHALGVATPDEVEITFEVDGTDDPDGNDNINGNGPGAGGAGDEVELTAPPAGLQVSSWGLRDERLWYELTQPRRITIKVQPKSKRTAADQRD